MEMRIWAMNLLKQKRFRFSLLYVIRKVLFLILTGVSGNGHFNKLDSVMKKSNSDGCIKPKKKQCTLYGKQIDSHNTNERKEFSESATQRMQLPGATKSKLCTGEDCNKGGERIVYENKCFEVYSGDQSPNLPVRKRKASGEVRIVRQDFQAMNENLFDDLFKVKRQHANVKESSINVAFCAAGREFSSNFMMETTKNSLRKNKRKLDHRLIENDVNKLLILPSEQNQRGTRKRNDRSRTAKFDICAMEQLYELDNGFNLSERRSNGMEELSHGYQRIEHPSVFITDDSNTDIGRESPDQRQNKTFPSRSGHVDENHCRDTKPFKGRRNENYPHKESSEKKTVKVSETEHSCDASKVDQGQKKANSQVCRNKSGTVKNRSGLLEMEAAKFEDFFIVSNAVISTQSCGKNFIEKKLSKNSCGRDDKDVVSSKSIMYSKQKKNKWNTDNPDEMSNSSSESFITNAYFDKCNEMREKCSRENDLKSVEVNGKMKTDDIAKTAVNLDTVKIRGEHCQGGKLEKETGIAPKKSLNLRRRNVCWNIDPLKTAGKNINTKVQKVETSRKIYTLELQYIAISYIVISIITRC